MSNTGKVICLIPARAGSKGVLNKNLIDMCGKPLLAWSILQALSARYIDRVIVTTDSPVISQVALHYGAEVPFVRPPEISGDHSTDLEAFEHALHWMSSHEGSYPDLVVHLRPTGPIRLVDDINRAVETLKSDNFADSLRSVSLAEHTPYKMWKTLSDERIVPLIEIQGFDVSSSPRQLLPKVYWQNGYVDIVRAKTVIEKKSMTGSHVIPFITKHKIYELDYPEDINPLRMAMGDFLESKKLPYTPERDSV
jgi:CMP-N,N'-diacetyllegionaminic acid synthase